MGEREYDRSSELFTIYYLLFVTHHSRLDEIGRREIRASRSEPVIEPALQVGDRWLPRSLALLNNEEVH